MQIEAAFEIEFNICKKNNTEETFDTILFLYENM